MTNPLRPWRAEVVDGFTTYCIPPAGTYPGGTGPTDAAPVLLLNGCALPAATWMPVIEALPHREVMAIDRPGFGGTTWAVELPSLATEVAAVERIILGASFARPPIVVAHSMAAFRAEALVRLRPDLVSALVLVDPSIEGQREVGLAGRVLEWGWRRGLVARIGPASLRRAVAFVSYRVFQCQVVSAEHLGTGVFRDPYSNPETLKSALAEWLSYRRQGVDLNALRANADTVATPAAALVAAPFPVQRRRTVLTSNLRLRNWTEVSGSGHLMMIDRPDAIVQAIDEI